jgi:hypothetical protein
MDRKRVYNLIQIQAACVIGSPIVAGILIYNNYKNFGDRQKGILWIIIGILWTIAVIGLAMLLPENIVDITRMVVPILNGLILYPIINSLQGAKIKEHFYNNGEKGSNWLVAGLTIFVLALILTPIILLDRISPINDYARQPFEANGVYYNSEMPVEEVNKLGGILKRIQYFNPESPSEVVFITTDTTYEFKLITEKSFFSNRAYLTDIQQIFKHVGRYDFNKPLTFMITEPFLKNDKIIELIDYDSIPLLLESEFFLKNQNFNLIYDMSIDKSEREKFQRLIMSLDKIFIPQNRFDFLMDYENDFYFMILFIPKQNWNNPQLLSESRFIKERLNNYGFKYPFKFILVDNTNVNIEEFEIEYLRTITNGIVHAGLALPIFNSEVCGRLWLVKKVGA